MAIVLLVAGCVSGADNDHGETVEPPPVVPTPVGTVSIQPEIGRVTVGFSAQLTAETNLGTTQDVAWTTSDTTLAVIDSTGVFLAKGIGNGVVKATVRTKSGASILGVAAFEVVEP